jgi:hypothetical protein
MSADGRPFPVPVSSSFLLLFDDTGRCRFQVLARPEGPRDGVDPVSELAAFALVSDLPQAALFIPARMRDLDGGGVISRPIVMTRAERLPDGRVELDATAVLLGENGSDEREPPPVLGSHAIEPALSPVGSLLCDALLTCSTGFRLDEVGAVLASWDHIVLGDPPLADVDHGPLGKVRYQVHRLADELAQRHRPMALADDARRPAAPANLPVGFVPACPL